MSEELYATLTAEQTLNATIAIAKGDKGDKGDAYVITEADKQEIKEALSGDISELKGDLADVFSVGKNMVNTSGMISNADIDATTGEIVSGSYYVLPKLIKVNIGEEYTVSKSGGLVYLYPFNEDGSFNNTTYSPTNSALKYLVTIGVPTNVKTFTAQVAKYMVVSMLEPSDINLQLEKGGTATQYEKYKKELNSDITIPLIGDGELNTESKTVIPAVNEVYNTTLKNLDTINCLTERTYNLFNPHIRYSGYLLPDGQIVSSSSFITTEYIPVIGGTLRTIPQWYNCAFFDSENRVVSFLEGGSNTEIPENASYVRLSFTGYDTLESANSKCVYVSDTEKQFIPYTIIKKVAIPKEESVFPSVDMVLPRKLIVADGIDVAINYQSVVKNWDVTNSVSKFVQNNVFPTYGNKTIITGGKNVSSIKIAHVPDYNIGIIVKTLDIINVPKDAGNGLTKKILFIGDSKTDANVYTQKLIDMFSKDGMSIELLGSRGNSDNNRHEGRSGWSARMYCTNEYERGVEEDSPFYNPSTSQFDFDYYMTQKGYSNVDYVFICLGTNDSENNFINYYNEMIRSVKAYDSNIVIGIWTPAPFATFGGYTHTTNDLQNFGKIEAILNEFDTPNYENDKIFVVPTHMNIDTFYDFGWKNIRYNDVSEETYRVCTDPIHEVNGYCHDADVIFGYIKYFATL